MSQRRSFGYDIVEAVTLRGTRHHTIDMRFGGVLRYLREPTRKRRNALPGKRWDWSLHPDRLIAVSRLDV